MTRLPFAIAVATVLSLSNATFTVDFNSADHCAGTIIGQFEGTTGTGCQTTYGNYSDSNSPVVAPGGGNNAVIHVSGITKDTGVAFYGEANCNVLIALGNVETCMGIGAYTSFEVIDITDQELDWVDLELASVLSISPKATVTMTSGAKLTESAPSMPSANTNTALAGMRQKRDGAQRASISPNSERAYIEHMINGKSIEHGAIRRAGGQVYKYQQIAARAWRGISLHEWNDQVHTRNERDLAPPLNRRAQETSRKALSAFETRAIPATSCNLIRSCMVDSGDDPNFSIDQVGDSLLSAIHTLNPGAKDWTFLEAPLVVEILDSKGAISGYIYAHTLEHSLAVNTCSDLGTERDALQAALAMGVDGTAVSDMRVDLKLLSGTGVTNSLFVSTRSIANADKRIHPICEAVQVNF